MLYVIWWARNKLIHVDKEPTTEEVRNYIRYLNINDNMYHARRKDVTNQHDHTLNINKQNK